MQAALPEDRRVGVRHPEWYIDGAYERIRAAVNKEDNGKEPWSTVHKMLTLRADQGDELDGLIKSLPRNSLLQAERACRSWAISRDSWNADDKALLYMYTHCTANSDEASQLLSGISTAALAWNIHERRRFRPPVALAQAVARMTLLLRPHQRG